VRVDYLSHWRPVVRYLELGNLMVGHNSRYFISTEDADTRPIELSRINITDITRDVKVMPAINEEFEGTAIRLVMEQPGNYKADVQVFDGFVWSDVYEVGYTVHVISTDEQKKAYPLYELSDDPAMESADGFPPVIRPDDGAGMKGLKRAANGGYILGKRVGDFIKAYVPFGEMAGFRKL
jgi:hypothetical protein